MIQVIADEIDEQGERVSPSRTAAGERDTHPVVYVNALCLGNAIDKVEARLQALLEEP